MFAKSSRNQQQASSRPAFEQLPGRISRELFSAREAERERSPDPLETFRAATTGSTSPLPYRAEMERAFQHDFSGVRVFADRPVELEALGARAATMGETVVFADANPPRETVAHELTHVVQTSLAHATPTASIVSSPGDFDEVNARQAQAQVILGNRPEVRTSEYRAPLQLQSILDVESCYLDPHQALRERQMNWERDFERQRRSPGQPTLSSPTAPATKTRRQSGNTAVLPPISPGWGHVLSIGGKNVGLEFAAGNEGGSLKLKASAPIPAIPLVVEPLFKVDVRPTLSGEGVIEVKPDDTSTAAVKLEGGGSLTAELGIEHFNAFAGVELTADVPVLSVSHNPHKGEWTFGDFQVSLKGAPKAGVKADLAKIGLSQKEIESLNQRLKVENEFVWKPLGDLELVIVRVNSRGIDLQRGAGIDQLKVEMQSFASGLKAQMAKIGARIEDNRAFDKF